MNNFSDQEVLNFLHQQEQNFINTAKGSGFNAREAKVKLEVIRKQSKEERLTIGRESLSKIKQ